MPGAKPTRTPSTLWLYVDGTQESSLGVREGTVTFQGGLNQPDNYDVDLLENDGYTILARERFSVRSDSVAPPPLSFQRDGNSLVISWPVEAGGFTLEQTSSLTQPDWSTTPGVIGNSALRLRRLSVRAARRF